MAAGRRADRSTAAGVPRRYGLLAAVSAPLGGRTFECYSEDPELTGALAAAYVRGVQSHDVAVTVKHFAANDTEVERTTVDVDVDERTLRELYLRPFERTVKDARAWGVMSSYNKVAGEYAALNRRLLTDILRDEWGFDGFVVSDWYGVHEAAPAANAGLDLGHLPRLPP